MQVVDVSVIIPVFNGESYLAEAIESVLTQSIQPREIIVVDDGSSDASAMVARRFSDRIQLHQQANRGAAAARNRGIEISSGSFLAFLDADDFWTPGKLDLQWQVLQNHPEQEMVLGNVVQFISPDVDGLSRQRLRQELETMPAYLIGAMLIRRGAFFKVGLLNEKLQLGEYIDWFQRGRDLGLSWHMLDEVVLKRRIHCSNQGITKRAHMADYITVLKAALDRKRRMHREGRDK